MKRKKNKNNNVMAFYCCDECKNKKFIYLALGETYKKEIKCICGSTMYLINENELKEK